MDGTEAPPAGSETLPATVEKPFTALANAAQMPGAHARLIGPGSGAMAAILS